MGMRTAFGLIALLCRINVLASTPWERYLNEPTAPNADAVTSLEYSPDSTPAGGYAFADLLILQNQVLAGDEHAFRLAYRLYRASDGGLSEDLGGLLARVIRPRPFFFLQQIAALRVPCSDLRWILRHPGEEYVDRPDARLYELEMRRKALSDVSNRRLRRIRDDCIAAYH